MTILVTDDEKAGTAVQLTLPIEDNHRILCIRDELDLISPADFAMVIGVTEQTLAGWRSEGEGPAFVKAGRTVFYTREDIAAWLQSRKTIPTIGTAIAA